MCGKGYSRKGFRSVSRTVTCSSAPVIGAMKRVPTSRPSQKPPSTFMMAVWVLGVGASCADARKVGMGGRWRCEQAERWNGWGEQAERWG